MMTKETSKKKNLLAIGTVGAVLLTTILSAVSATRFPQASGPYQVGTAQSEWVDTGRDRRLLVQFYYPTAERPVEKIPYTPNSRELEADLSTLYGIPKFLIRKISRAKVPVSPDAQPLHEGQRFPLLIFSHGYNGSRFQNTFLLPELAARGYVIASIEHTGSASGTVFADGSTGYTTPFDSVTRNEPYTIREIEKWSLDQRFVLDQIESRARNSQWALGQSIDLGRVGVFGHSYGGATSAATLTQDTRFRAGINIDGFYFGEFYKVGFDQPFMELRADNKSPEEMTDKDLEEWQFTREEYRKFLFEDWNLRLNSYARNGYESYTIRHADHMSFTDFSLMMPLAFITAPHRDEHHQITTELVLVFFDKHLKQERDSPGLPAALQAYLK